MLFTSAFKKKLEEDGLVRNVLVICPTFIAMRRGGQPGTTPLSRNCQTEKSTVTFFLDVSGALQLRRLSNWHAGITATADAVASSRLLNSSFLPVTAVPSRA